MKCSLELFGEGGEVRSASFLIFYSLVVIRPLSENLIQIILTYKIIY